MYNVYKPGHGGVNVAELKDRIENEAKACIGACNANVVCADCVQRYDDSLIPANATKCEAYPNGKPLAIVFGETKECDEYVKE